MIVLFLNHKMQSCGVYQYGFRVFNILQKSNTNTYIYKEIENYNEYIDITNIIKPNIIIYNYHAATMTWLNNNNILKNTKNIGIPHESNGNMFDLIVSINPNEPETNKIFNIPRPIYENVDKILDNYKITNKKIEEFINYTEGSNVPIFGSFGFGFLFKGFDKIIKIVNDNYDAAIIKLVITFADMDPNKDANINNILQICNSIIRKPNVKLMILTDFLTNEEVLLFLKSNTCNIFLYDKLEGRGTSSVIDYAISVNKPFVISDSSMFCHVYSDDICVYKTNIKDAIENSKKMLPNLVKKYSNKNLINKVNKIACFTKTTNFKGIFYNSKKAMCSIYESGLMVYKCLKKSHMYELEYTEDTNFLYNYDFCVVNQHVTVNNWITENMIKKFNNPAFCIVTEVSFSNNYIDKSPNYYSAYIVLDSSINENKNIYGFPRPLEDYIVPTTIESSIPIIGSFGFATEGKYWYKIVEETQKEFDKAIIRFNIPKATYVPNHQGRINVVIQRCNAVLKNPNIKLEITHHNFSKEELINWCANNTVNCFLYNRENIYTSGLCATADQAIMSGKPLLVSKDCTFRHIHKYIDYYPNISIKQAIQNTTNGVKKMKNDWSSNNFLKKFESIFVLYKNIVIRI